MLCLGDQLFVARVNQQPPVHHGDGCCMEMDVGGAGATVNQHPPVHHPLDADYCLVVDEPQLRLFWFNQFCSK